MLNRYKSNEFSGYRVSNAEVEALLGSTAQEHVCIRAAVCVL